MQKEKDKLSAKKFTIYDDYRNGNSSREKYLNELKKIQERQAEIGIQIPVLEQQMKKAEEKIKGVKEKEEYLAGIAALQTFDRDILSKVIDKIYVYEPDKVEIIWKSDDIFFSEKMTQK